MNFNWKLFFSPFKSRWIWKKTSPDISNTWLFTMLRFLEKKNMYIANLSIEKKIFFLRFFFIVNYICVRTVNKDYFSIHQFRFISPSSSSFDIFVVIERIGSYDNNQIILLYYILHKDQQNWSCDIFTWYNRCGDFFFSKKKWKKRNILYRFPHIHITTIANSSSSSH